MKKWFARFWHCWLFGFHYYTCAAEQGIPPTKEQIEGGVEGFFDYARMYCKRCGHVYESPRLRRGHAGQ